MKNTTLFFGVLLISLTNTYSQDRNILWLGGIGATSTNWAKFIQSADNQGYDFNAISTWNYAPHLNSVNTSSGQMNGELNNGNYTNVLGIGHDGGGIVLRQMANEPNTNLTAIILDGVPNQGSKALEAILPHNGISEIDKIIEKLLHFKSNANGCNACGLLSVSQGFFAEIKSFEERYREFLPSSPLISNLGTPSIPYAIIWGNESDDALTLDRLLGSRSNQAINSGLDTDYIECFRDEIEDRRQAINAANLDGLVNSLSGLANSIGKFLKKDSTRATALEGVGTTINSIYGAIKSERERNRALAELLECELIHQALNAYWNLIVSDSYEPHYVYIEVPANCEELCADEPDAQVAAWCYYDCLLYGTTEQIVIEYQQYKKHDGLYSEVEQSLSGAAKTYEAKGMNHFQEQYWEYMQVRDHFADLFQGNVSMAFHVPK